MTSTSATNNEETFTASTVTITTSSEISIKNEVHSLSVVSKEEVDAQPDLWKPIIPNYLLQSNSSQSDQMTDEKTAMVQPVIMVKPKRETITNAADTEKIIRQSNKRSFEIPALSNSPSSLIITGEVTNSTSNENLQENATTEHKPVMVQLFPYRIASMFEKAERYARQTILPYLTEQFPTFFKTNIELYDDNDTNIIEDSKFLVDTFDTVKPEKRAFRESIHSSRRTPKGKDYIRQYRNLSGVQNVFADNDSTQPDVSKIDLPTYRPTKPTTTITTRKPKYIPLERG